MPRIEYGGVRVRLDELLLVVVVAAVAAAAVVVVDVVVVVVVVKVVEVVGLGLTLNPEVLSTPAAPSIEVAFTPEVPTSASNVPCMEQGGVRSDSTNSCRDGGNTFTPERYRLELNSAHTVTGRQGSTTHNSPSQSRRRGCLSECGGVRGGRVGPPPSREREQSSGRGPPGRVCM